MPPPAFKADEFRIHPDHDAAYRVLEDAAKKGQKPQQAIWKRFKAARKMLDHDPLWGDVIRAGAIPAYFRERYGVENLYCIDLKGDVRCFYTIDERTVLFLDIVDHDQYDKWFPPKGRKARR
jgi:mRNA-degrading endonuclease RelE of RelBE toxin-antitoxin system